MRKHHVLGKYLSNETVNEMIIYDTETNQEEDTEGDITHKLMFGWAAYMRRGSKGKWLNPSWYYFTDAEAFCGWVAGRHRPRTHLYLWCHNTNFDIPVLDLIRRISGYGYLLQSAIIDAPPTILTWLGEEGKLTHLDSLNIWPMSLKALGESIGLPKISYPSVGSNREIWDTYCKRDVEVLIKLICGWLDWLVSEDMGGFAPTMASQALRTYRHKYMKDKIVIDNNVEALELSRKAYKGGRTECFRLGELPTGMSLLDVNSMYPYVMLNHEYPAQLVGYVNNPSIDEVTQWTKTRCITAKCLINTNEPTYGVKLKKRLVFPIGEMICVLTTPEIAHAISKGRLIKVLACCVYTKRKLFNLFVSDIYSKRLEAKAIGDVVGSNRWKLFLNSLYGKFGQRGLVWEDVGNTDDLAARKWSEIDIDTGDTYRWRMLGGLRQRQSKQSESTNSHPAIAAHVTAYARMLLWQMISEAGDKEVYYCDTDSLLVTPKGFCNLEKRIDATRLGGLKHEASYDTGNIYGNKDYVMGTKTRTKGVRSQALWLNSNTIEQDKWSSLRGTLLPSSDGKAHTKRVVKHLRRIYTKGTVADNGWISPLELTPNTLLDDC